MWLVSVLLLMAVSCVLEDKMFLVLQQLLDHADHSAAHNNTVMHLSFTLFKLAKISTAFMLIHVDLCFCKCYINLHYQLVLDAAMIKK